MKLIILTVCLLFVATQHIRGDDGSVADVVQECLNESDIKESDFTKLKDSDDPKLRCIMACVMEKGGILKNGEIKLDLLKNDLLEDAEQLGEKKVSDLVDNCGKIVKDVTDVCDKTNIMGLCIKEELEKYNIKYE